MVQNHGKFPWIEISFAEIYSFFLFVVIILATFLLNTLATLKADLGGRNVYKFGLAALNSHMSVCVPIASLAPRPRTLRPPLLVVYSLQTYTTPVLELQNALWNNSVNQSWDSYHTSGENLRWYRYITILLMLFSLFCCIYLISSVCFNCCEIIFRQFLLLCFWRQSEEYRIISNNIITSIPSRHVED